MEVVASLLFAPMDLFVGHPLYALVPAAVVLVVDGLFWLRRRTPWWPVDVPLWGIAVFWIAFAAWEWKVLRDFPADGGGGPPIRVDLLLLGPIAYLTIAIAIVCIVVQIRCFARNSQSPE